MPVNLEDDLRAALRRESPPSDFAARVLAKTLRKTRVIPFWRRPAAMAIAAAVALAAVIPSVYEYQRQRRGIEARDQLVLALSITKVQLQQAREKIRHNARHKQ
jgi:negative regulator of sigma E activity